MTTEAGGGRPGQTLLAQVSSDLAAVVEQAGRAVVRVAARPRLAGSGLAWGEGVIVTADHVVEAEDDIAVGLPDGQTAKATLAGRDPTTDVAVLRYQGAVARPPLAREGDLRVGGLVLAVGRPGRSGPMATLGVVSAVEGAWRTPAGGRMDALVQADVTLLPGFSGGALVDASGALVGMLTSHLGRGVATVVPAGTLQRVVELLLAEGRVRRGYLGVATQRVRLPEAQAQQAGQDAGLLIVGLEAGGPAERDGLLLGDILVAVDGQSTRAPEELQALLGPERVGRAAAVRVLRGGRPVEVTVTVGERP